MDSNIPSYTRGNKTYYDTAGLSFAECMKVSFVAGYENGAVFDSTRMDCPKWVEQQVLARRRREAQQLRREQLDIYPSTHQHQEDLFKPRKMSGIQPESHELVRSQTSLTEAEWQCEYCQMMNNSKSDICAHCGAPK